MRLACLVAAGLLLAGSASAQFNAYYKGTQLDGDKEIPVTGQFSVEKGRVAVVMKGSRTSRMLFLEKEQVLRIVDEDGKQYVDMDKETLAGTQRDMSEAMAQARAQLDKLPPEQRAMAEKMMQGGMGAAQERPKTEYVWTKEKQTVRGYDCTRVDVMQGDTKRAEYWGAKSPDFEMKADERATVLAMQDYLRDYVIQVTSVGGAGGGGQGRAFQWDTSVDGFPLISRCFDGDKMTLELRLESVDRKPLAGDLFEIPAGFHKQDLSGGMGRAGRKRPRE